MHILEYCTLLTRSETKEIFFARRRHLTSVTIFGNSIQTMFDNVEFLNRLRAGKLTALKEVEQSLDEVSLTRRRPLAERFASFGSFFTSFGIFLASFGSLFVSCFVETFHFPKFVRAARFRRALLRNAVLQMRVSNVFRFKDVFNDLSVVRFHSDLLKDVPRPVYSIDDEIILREAMQNLSVNET